ncbi:hypothetical protein [Anaerobacillus alkalilacustris]|nr:hypothetical protein [Anaerobacillus alkalilacustris]
MNKLFSGFTNKTAENLLLDAGAFFKNFIVGTDTFESAVTAGKLLGATKGGGQFSAIPEIRNVEVDGVKGKAEGMQMIDSWEVKMSANIIEITKEVLAAAIGASEIDTTTSEDYDIIKGKTEIELSDYIGNITYVGRKSGSSEPIIIQIYNSFNKNGLTLQTQPKNEAVVALEFEGHFKPEELDKVPFEIFYPKAS